MFWRQLRNYLIPQPGALTLVWAAVIACGIIAAFSAVVGLSTASLSTGLVGFSALGLPVMAVLLSLAAWRESRAGPRALLLGGTMLVIALAGATFTLGYILDNPGSASAGWMLYTCCCAPVFLVPGVLSLVFALKSWPELRAILQADRAQRAMEILSARGEATFAEIGREVELPEYQVENLLNGLVQAGKLAAIIDPVIQRAYTLVALLEKYRRLAAVVGARGQIHLDDLSAELRAPRELIREWVHDLVRRDQFSGYVDWEKGMLYSLDVEYLGGLGRCPNCGGEVNLAGKGVIRCRYCAVEFFVPRQVTRRPGEKMGADKDMPGLDRQELPALSFGEPSPAPAGPPETGDRFERLRELFQPSGRARRILKAVVILLALALLCNVSLLLASSPQDRLRTGLLVLGLIVLPLTGLLLVVGALVERRAPPRALLWGGVTLAFGLAGVVITALMSADPEGGLGLGVNTMIILVAPILLLFSSPAIYFGARSWPEVLAVLRADLSERAMRLIQTRGEITFAEIARTLEMPEDTVDDLVDELLRSRRLVGTMNLPYERVYTAEALNKKQQMLLELIRIKGQVHLEDIGRHLNAPPDLLRDWIYQLMQLGRFSGYINWAENLLYSMEAGKLGAATLCPNCGGELGLAGEQVIQCLHCGSEIFRG